MIKLKNILNEENFSGKTFISVDIQPLYEHVFKFETEEYVEFLNEINCKDLIFLYNGRDYDGDTVEECKQWLSENGLSDKTMNNITFYNKGYAFFTACMDEGVDDDHTVNFVRFLYNNNIRSSHDMTRDMWAKYIRKYRHTDKRELYDLLKHSSDYVYIPDLMGFIKKYNNITLTGGGMNECLREVEIALKSLNKPYQIYNKFTY